MNFFKKTWVRVAAWIVLFLDIVVLFLGGVTEADISQAVKLGFVAIAAVAGIIAFISSHAKIKELATKK